jgi:hypothetical protein
MSTCPQSCVGEVGVTFDAAELANGLCATALRVSRDDPGEPRVDVSVAPVVTP